MIMTDTSYLGYSNRLYLVYKYMPICRLMIRQANAVWVGLPGRWTANSTYTSYTSKDRSNDVCCSVETMQGKIYFVS